MTNFRFAGLKPALALLALLVSFAPPTPAAADDTDWGWLKGAYDGEIGVRGWAGMGKTGKTLYDGTGTAPVSRLTYDGLVGASGELFGQINERNYFIKGVAGLGSLMRGTLQDEDFAPFITPYSSTDSELHNGLIGYATLDGGMYFAETPHARLGAFVGYSYLRQDVNAFGCTQTATNPDVCVPTIDTSINGISQHNSWNGIRIGLNGDMRFGKGWRLSGEAAALPFVNLSGKDFHWLRIGSDFSGGIPEDGWGWGYQLEAMLDYTVAERVTVGVGARYWHMQTSGSSHFEDVTTTGGPQRVDWATDYYGLTAHAAWQY